jgi:hypothetical protein
VSLTRHGAGVTVRLLTLLAGCALVVGCSGNDGSPATSTEAPGSPATDPPASSTPEAGETTGPVIGASHVLLPAPGADGVLLVTAPPERVSDSGPMQLWRWDGAAWSLVEAPEPAPTSRSFFAAAHDPARDVVVVYGGEDASGVSDETWEWDGTSWRSVEASAPGARAAAALAWDPTSDSVVLYSGHGADGAIRDDAWAWDGQAWTRLSENGPMPGRWPAAMVADDDQLLVYGGHQVADESLPAALDDTWLWAEGTWSLADDAGGPGPLVNAQGLTHPTLGTLLAGGSDLDGETSDVWRWTGDRWELLAADVLPPRQAFGMAYDDARGVVVLTGGVVQPGELARHQDVWEWSGSPDEPAVLVDDRPPA